MCVPRDPVSYPGLAFLLLVRAPDLVSHLCALGAKQCVRFPGPRDAGSTINKLLIE